jgi:hypothetical protein
MSFNIGGDYRIDEIDRSSFQMASKEIGIGERIAMERFDYISERFERALSDTAEIMVDCGIAYVFEVKDKILQTGVKV